ncbi:MAG: hypothetical protein ACRDPF_25460 [Streptosporangiaceae bacterium]
MTWVDGSHWDQVRGAALVDLLVNGYPADYQMRALVTDLGMSQGVMPAPMDLGLMWFELAQTMHQSRTLRRAAGLLVAKTPALAERVAELLADDLRAIDGNPADPYQVALLAGRRPLIDRRELRTTLKEFLDYNLPAFVVRGESRTGKTYSFQLILHIAAAMRNVLVVHVDFSQAATGDSAAALMARLRSRLGLPQPTDGDGDSTRTRSVLDQVDQLVGTYRFNDQLRRIIVIDGLNRTGLQGDVNQLAAMLITEVAHNQLPRTQLVLTGYTGEVDPAHGDLVAKEDVLTITSTHIRSYFEGLVLGRALADDELNDLVAEALRGEGDIQDLAQRVRDCALRLLQPVDAASAP